MFLIYKHDLDVQILFRATKCYGILLFLFRMSVSINHFLTFRSVVFALSLLNYYSRPVCRNIVTLMKEIMPKPS